MAEDEVDARVKLSILDETEGPLNAAVNRIKSA